MEAAIVQLPISLLHNWLLHWFVFSLKAMVGGIGLSGNALEEQQHQQQKVGCQLWV